MISSYSFYFLNSHLLDQSFELNLKPDDIQLKMKDFILQIQNEKKIFIDITDNYGNNIRWRQKVKFYLDIQPLRITQQRALDKIHEIEIQIKDFHSQYEILKLNLDILDSVARITQLIAFEIQYYSNQYKLYYNEKIINCNDILVNLKIKNGDSIYIKILKNQNNQFSFDSHVDDGLNVEIVCFNNGCKKKSIINKFYGVFDFYEDELDIFCPICKSNSIQIEKFVFQNTCCFEVSSNNKHDLNIRKKMYNGYEILEMSQLEISQAATFKFITLSLDRSNQCLLCQQIISNEQLFIQCDAHKYHKQCQKLIEELFNMKCIGCLNYVKKENPKYVTNTNKKQYQNYNADNSFLDNELHSSIQQDDQRTKKKEINQIESLKFNGPIDDYNTKDFQFYEQKNVELSQQIYNTLDSKFLIFNKCLKKTFEQISKDYIQIALDTKTQFTQTSQFEYKSFQCQTEQLQNNIKIELQNNIQNEDDNSQLLQIIKGQFQIQTMLKENNLFETKILKHILFNNDKQIQHDTSQYQISTEQNDELIFQSFQNRIFPNILYKYGVQINQRFRKFDKGGSILLKTNDEVQKLWKQIFDSLKRGFLLIECENYIEYIFAQKISAILKELIMYSKQKLFQYSFHSIADKEVYFKNNLKKTYKVDASAILLIFKRFNFLNDIDQSFNMKLNNLKKQNKLSIIQIEARDISFSEFLQLTGINSIPQLIANFPHNLEQI